MSLILLPTSQSLPKNDSSVDSWWTYIDNIIFIQNPVCSRVHSWWCTVWDRTDLSWHVSTIKYHTHYHTHCSKNPFSYTILHSYHMRVLLLYTLTRCCKCCKFWLFWWVCSSISLLLHFLGDMMCFIICLSDICISSLGR